MKSRKLKIILDTNILLVSISEYSQYHWLYKALINKEFDIYITNEILTEYEEVISKKLNNNTAKSVIRTLLELSNVIPTTIYYKTNFIVNDIDDNKFIDCAFASNCDFLVTNDKHFNIVKEIKFLKINIIKLHEFKQILKEL